MSADTWEYRTNSCGSFLRYYMLNCFFTAFVFSYGSIHVFPFVVTTLFAPRVPWSQSHFEWRREKNRRPKRSIIFLLILFKIPHIGSKTVKNVDICILMLSLAVLTSWKGRENIPSILLRKQNAYYARKEAKYFAASVVVIVIFAEFVFALSSWKETRSTEVQKFKY